MYPRVINKIINRQSKLQCVLIGFWCFSLRKKLPNFEIIFWDKNSPNLDSAFSLVPVFFGNQVTNSNFFGCQVGSSDFFVANFRHFAYNILEKKYSVTNSVSQKTKSPRTRFSIKKFTKIFHHCLHHGTRGAWDFSTFIFWISPNLAKYSYGWSPLEQHHKIDFF